jgi:hypothetical protein
LQDLAKNGLRNPSKARDMTGGNKAAKIEPTKRTGATKLNRVENSSERSKVSMGADLQRISGNRTGIGIYTRSPIEYTFISARGGLLKNLKISLRFLVKND